MYHVVPHAQVKKKSWGEMGHWVNVLTTKPDDLSLRPRPRGEGESQLPQGHPIPHKHILEG